MVKLGFILIIYAHNWEHHLFSAYALTASSVTKLQSKLSVGILDAFAESTFIFAVGMQHH